MRYWDASALVPLVVDEHGSSRARALLREDPAVITWGWTQVEIVGAVERRAREGLFTRAQRQAAFQRLEILAAAWDEVVDLLAVRSRAAALLARHALRAADAAQLGAALLASEGDPASLPFVCFDERLATAAEREGMLVFEAK